MVICWNFVAVLLRPNLVAGICGVQILNYYKWACTRNSHPLSWSKGRLAEDLKSQFWLGTRETGYQEVWGGHWPPVLCLLLLWMPLYPLRLHTLGLLFGFVGPAGGTGHSSGLESRSQQRTSCLPPPPGGSSVKLSLNSLKAESFLKDWKVLVFWAFIVQWDWSLIGQMSNFCDRFATWIGHFDIWYCQHWGSKSRMAPAIIGPSLNLTMTCRKHLATCGLCSVMYAAPR